MDIQALEGKDVKDILVNVGSGGGAAAAAPAAGGAAAGGDAPAAAEEEKKEEGTSTAVNIYRSSNWTNNHDREGGIGRGYGLRSLRLDCLFSAFLYFLYRYHTKKLLHAQRPWRILE